MSEIFDKIKNLVEIAAKSEAAEQAKVMAITALTKVKAQINAALDNAIESLTGASEETSNVIKVAVDRKKEKEPLKAPGRIIEWFAKLPNDKSTYYINLYREGQIRLLENGTIDGPDFYVKPNSFNILTKRKMTTGITRVRIDERCDMIYDDLSQVPVNINPTHIYRCRVTIPKANMRNKDFPELYIVSEDDNKMAVRATYRDYIINSGKYESAILAHAANPKNIRGTGWMVNISVCSMNRKPRVA